MKDYDYLQRIKDWMRLLIAKPKQKKEFVSLLTLGLNPTTNTFNFNITISGEEMYYLKRWWLLKGWVSLEKNKEAFLRDLAEVLQIEILKQLRELSNDKT